MNRRTLLPLLAIVALSGCSNSVELDSVSFEEPAEDFVQGPFCSDQFLVDCGSAVEGRWRLREEGGVAFDPETLECRDLSADFVNTTGEISFEGCSDEGCGCGEGLTMSASMEDLVVPNDCSGLGLCLRLQNNGLSCDRVRGQCSCNKVIEIPLGPPGSCSLEESIVKADDVDLHCCFDPENEELRLYVDPLEEEGEDESPLIFELTFERAIGG